MNTFAFIHPRPRGSILIITIGIMIVLTGLALVFSREMRVEALASGNLVSSVQADCIVNGAADHVINQLTNNTDRTLLDSVIQSQSVQLGEGQFWIIRPNADDERRMDYGLADEAGKLNINTATLDMLLALPGMTSELAASIIDWRDPDDTVTEGGGAESEYYLLLPDPYYCKNAPFETLDELLLLKGATREILFGVDANRNGVVDDTESSGGTQLSGLNGNAQCGICKYLTVYSVESNASQSGSPRVFVGDNRGQTLTQISELLGKAGLSGDRVAEITLKVRASSPSTNIFDFYQKSGMTIDEFKKIAGQITTDRLPVLVGRINVNTAPKEVLRCLPGLADSDVDQLIARRSSNGADLTNIAWVAEVLTPAKAAGIGSFVTTRSFQYSADIVGVNGNGRGFKRMKFVFDMRTTTPRIVYSKDLTYLGWPLNSDVAQGSGFGNSMSFGAR